MAENTPFTTVELMLHQLNVMLEKRLKIDRKAYFDDDFTMNKTMQDYFNTLSNDVVQDKTSALVVLEELATYGMMTTLYSQTVVEEQPELFNQLLSRTALYAHYLLTVRSDPTHDYLHFVEMRKAVYLWASLFLCGWNKKAMNIGHNFIESINGNSGIIRYGCRLYPESWFAIDLYSAASGEEYNKKRADYPEDMNDSYRDIISEWDTEDTSKVDNFIYLLAELHLLMKEKDEDDADEYFDFGNPLLKLYPYEIIIYLAIRKQNNLKNPTEFSHPLINTPLSQLFLNLDTPLAEPTELPFAEELLAKLKTENTRTGHL